MSRLAVLILALAVMFIASEANSWMYHPKYLSSRDGLTYDYSHLDRVMPTSDYRYIYPEYRYVSPSSYRYYDVPTTRSLSYEIPTTRSYSYEIPTTRSWYTSGYPYTNKYYYSHLWY
jgi:hypothetical protein